MRFTVAAMVALIGCTNGSTTGTDPGDDLWVLSNTDGSVAARLEVVSRPRNHDRPTDLGFNPEVSGELWVVNKRDDTATIIDDAGTEAQVEEVIEDPFALHFMEEVTSIAFGAPGTFATCQDGTNTYNGTSQGNNFTGPTLWSSDRSIFGISNPEAVEALSDLFGFAVDLGSHIDMLHESPECMGIAWDRDNVYWVFDGFNQHIVRYDFAEDHGVGWDDHSDGVVSRHMSTEGIARVNGTVSHLVLDHDTGLLYVADTGNSRIMVLDTTTGREGQALRSPDCWQGQCVDHHEWRGSDWSELVDGTEIDMEWPAGIALVEGTLFVTDAKTNDILAFDLEGKLIERVSTGIEQEKSLAGIEAISLDELWIVDNRGDRVLRLRTETAATVK